MHVHTYKCIGNAMRYAIQSNAYVRACAFEKFLFMVFVRGAEKNNATNYFKVISYANNNINNMIFSTISMNMKSCCTLSLKSKTINTGKSI